MKINSTKTINNEVEDKTTFFYHMFRNILLVSLPLLIISTFALYLPHSSATISNSGTDRVTLELSVACTISTNLIDEHKATLSGSGLHRENIGNTKVNTYCNDNNGYNVYAVGNSNNIDGNTDLVSNLSDSYNIHTGIYDENNPSSLATSSWGMKLTAGTGTGIDPVTGESVNITPPTIRNNYNNYNVVPNVYTLVASRASGTSMTTNTTASGSYFNTTYDIYASSVQPAGTYIGQVKYILTHPNTNAPNTINDIDAAFAIAGKQKIYYDENDNGPYYSMQDMTTDICNSATRNGEITTTQLVDVRDKKSYYVTKLKDGHCWMTQNLDFDIVTYTNNQGQEVMKPLTSNDTDLTDHSLTGAYIDGYNYNENTSIITWVPASTAKTIDFKGSTVTGWQDSKVEPHSASKTDDTKVGHSSLGNWYNWTAAIASNNSSALTSNTLNDISRNPQNSICPKGWRLPTISNQSETIPGSTNEFKRLNYLYNDGSTNNGIGLTMVPLNFVYSGYVVNSALNNLETHGDYWSETVYNSIDAYFIRLGNNFINPTYYYGRHSGASIRCLAR